MKILVIGSSGFVGRFLVQKLINNGYEVSGMDVIEADFKQNLVSFTKGDLVDKKIMSKACDGIDVIINLAAKHHDFGISREEFFRVNEKGMQIMLECAAEKNIKKIVFYSTVAVYGPHDYPVNEETNPKPVSDYGQSKLAAEKVLQKWIKEDNSREAVIIRPGVVFGPFNYANMYNLISNIAKSRFLPVGRNDNIKSVAYVENLVDATVFVMNNLKPGVSVYNYTDYPQTTTDKMLDVIYSALGKKKLKFHLPLAPILFFASIFDILGKVTGINFPITANRIKKFNTSTHFEAKKIRDAGFVQKVDIKTGLERMVKWYKEKITKK